MIKGYKAFNKDCTNRYGKVFVEGQTYHTEGELRFGNYGNGYHFCERLEDTLRYFPAMEEEIKIAEVTSLEDFIQANDETYGYYDMYAARTLRIDKFLTREEIITMYLDMNVEYQVKRFVASFKLTPEETELFKLKYADNYRIMQTIAYYQEDNKDVYDKPKVKRR